MATFNLKGVGLKWDEDNFFTVFSTVYHSLLMLNNNLNLEEEVFI